MPYDPLHPVDRGVTTDASQTWLDDPDTSAWYYEHLGDNAYREGDKNKALHEYAKAIPLELRRHDRYEMDNLDALLRTGRSLYELGNRAMARRLWLAYLLQSSAKNYESMAHAAKRKNFRDLFALMVRDSESYTQRNPLDLESGGLQWIYAGAERGAAGDFAGAQADFRESINCVLWDPAYGVFAWGAATYAVGNQSEARDAWVTATGEGDGSANGMPFNNNANAAAVTMLLNLFQD